MIIKPQFKLKEYENGLYLVSTPLGNLKDITLRAIEVLQQSHYILCEDTRVSKNLLDKYQIKSKLISNHKFNEKKNVEKIIEQCERNEIGFASARRFDTENIDLFFKNPINSPKIQRYLKNHCKFQSKRTLDLFLIKKQILKSLLSTTHELGLIPGTVLFDIYLFYLPKN